jgi:hypothetical protein
MEGDGQHSDLDRPFELPTDATGATCSEPLSAKVQYIRRHLLRPFLSESSSNYIFQFLQFVFFFSFIRFWTKESSDSFVFFLHTQRSQSPLLIPLARQQIPSKTTFGPTVTRSIVITHIPCVAAEQNN